MDVLTSRPSFASTGRLARALGGPHAGHRHHELSPRDELPRLERQPAPGRAADASRCHDAALRVHGQRSEDLDEAVDRGDSDEEGRCADLRVRVPRRQLRPEEHPQRRSHAGVEGERPVRSRFACLVVIVLGSTLLSGQGQRAKTLNIYVVDVEGGNATLVVSPSGESLLIDTGNTGAGAVRDATRIMDATRDAGDFPDRSPHHHALARRPLRRSGGARRADSHRSLRGSRSQRAAECRRRYVPERHLSAVARQGGARRGEGWRCAEGERRGRSDRHRRRPGPACSLTRRGRSEPVLRRASRPETTTPRIRNR